MKQAQVAVSQLRFCRSCRVSARQCVDSAIEILLPWIANGGVLGDLTVSKCRTWTKGSEHDVVWAAKLLMPVG